jgi:lysophospholipase L1-like esterase
MFESEDHRLCFIGDSFVQGTCDPECRGWPGRVSALARKNGHDITCYNLGIRRDTSRDIAMRWESECKARFRVACTPYVVFSFGSNDMTLENGSLRVPVDESVENFIRIITRSSSLYKTLVIGPLPVNDPEQDERILDISRAYSGHAAKTGVPFLSIAERLLYDPAWIKDTVSQDGTHPGSTGYDLISGFVTAWDSWWF